MESFRFKVATGDQIQSQLVFSKHQKACVRCLLSFSVHFKEDIFSVQKPRAMLSVCAANNRDILTEMK